MITRDRPNGSDRRVLFSFFVPVVCLLAVLVGTQAMGQASDSDRGKDQRATISDLESYQDMSADADSRRKYWMEVTYDDQWIGWVQIQSVTLRAFRADGSEPTNVYKYDYNFQIAPHLVRSDLVDKIREDVEKKRDKLGIAAHEVKKIVQKRVRARFKELKDVVIRRSSSSTIYLNDDRSFREAKYGRSSSKTPDFTLYLKPSEGETDALTVLVPGKVPKTVEPEEGRKIVNPPLATASMVEDQFEKSTYTYSFISGNPAEPLAQAEISVLDDQWEERKIGENQIKTRKLRLVFQHPKLKTHREEWWVDQKGHIVKAKVLPPPETERKPIVLRKVPRKKAMHGMEFVFARRGRRNPFKPVWPKSPPEGVSKKKEKEPKECQDFEPKKLFNTARTLVFEKAKKAQDISHKPSRIRFQRTLIRRFKTIKGRIDKCGKERQVEDIQKLQKQLKQAINIGAMILSIAEEQLKNARRAFEQRAFERIGARKEVIEKWKKQIPDSADEEVKKRFKEVVAAISKLQKRAKIQEDFLQNAPRIHGIVSSQEARSHRITLGVNLLGNQLKTKMDVSAPAVDSAAIIEGTTGGQQSQQAKQQNETIEIQGLGEATVQEIHRDGVVFKYKGESIKVPLIKTERAQGGG